MSSSNLAYALETWDELIDGQAVAVSPRPATNHNRIAYNISRILGNHFEGRKCEPFPDGIDLYLTEENRFVPDGMVVCDPDKVKDDGVYGVPDLVLEVLSPSTAKYDRGRKKDVYAQCGVREYWIVDPANRTVEQYFLENGQLVLHDVFADHPDCFLKKLTEEERAAIPKEFTCGVFQDLVIPLEDVFRRVT